MRLSHITHLLYTPRRALSIGFTKFGAIFNYFCAIFYEIKAGGGGQLCVIRIFYGGSAAKPVPDPHGKPARISNKKAEPYKRLRQSLTVFLSAQAPISALDPPG